MSEGGTAAAPRTRVRRFVESRRIQNLVTAVIVVNAVTLGLETSPTVMAAFGGLLATIDRAVVVFFVIEIGLRLYAHRLAFFRDGWSVFDFIIVAITLLPATGGMSVLRTLRVLRVLRLISVAPRLRAVVQALLDSLPGLGAIAGLLTLLYYVAAVMATTLFGPSFDEWFGTIGRSMYSLFQIMTLESWSMGIVRPVMQVYPFAWVFFVPFILIATFTMLNLFIAIIVSSMQALTQAEERKLEEAAREIAHGERVSLGLEIKELRAEVMSLHAKLDALSDRPERG